MPIAPAPWAKLMENHSSTSLFGEIMDRTPSARRRRRRSIAAVAVAATLVVAGCGSSDDSADQGDGDPAPGSTAPDSGTATTPDGDPEDGPSDPVDATIEVLVPQQTTAPAGFTTIDPSCASPDSGIGWFSYAVPDSWTPAGVSSGGSGSAFGSITDARFDTPSGSVTVTITPDDRDAEDRIVDGQGEPDETLDSEQSVDGTGVTVTQAGVSMVAVGDQMVELAVADQTQAGGSGETVYRARIEVLKAPSFLTNGETIRTESLVMSIHLGGDTVLSAEEAEEIVGSFSLPDCTLERFTITAEMSVNMDLDGDGRVSEAADLLEVVGQ